MTRFVGSKIKTCTWDQVDDFAADVDKVCCDGGNCGSNGPKKCTAGCAVAMHQFLRDCKVTLDGKPSLSDRSVPDTRTPGHTAI